MSLTVYAWEPIRSSDVTDPTLPFTGEGKNTFILDVYDTPQNQPCRLYRTWVHTDCSLKDFQQFAEQYPAKWEALWQEKFQQVEPVFYPVEVINEIMHSEMSAKHKLYLTTLVCADQLTEK